MNPTRRTFLKNASLTALAAAAPRALAHCGSCAGDTTPKPNILLMMVDDLGWFDVGFNGSKYYRTPNIDKLASQGMIFTRAYANAPNCAPTRACLLSGQYTPRHGVFTVKNSDRGPASQRKIIPIKTETLLDPKFVTIGETIQAAGYRTASMGKWHMGTDEYGPKNQGFDVNIAGNHSGSPKGGYFSPYNNPQLKDGPKGEHITDRIAQEACKFITDTNSMNKPFFLYLPFYGVHTPIQPKKELVGKYAALPKKEQQGKPAYAAMVEVTDNAVGTIMKTLDELKLAENTIVIFFSDNGGHGSVTTHGPLRGSKGMIYEGGIREPMCVRYPGVVKPGTKCDTPVIGIDFLPTLTKLAGGKLPTTQPVDGTDIMPLFKGGTIDREAIYFHEPVYLQGHIANASQRDRHFRIRPCSAIIKGDWKYVQYYENPGDVEMYNLKDDLGEKTNLAKKKPAKAKELAADLNKWIKDVKAPIPTEPNPKYAPTAAKSKGEGKDKDKKKNKKKDKKNKKDKAVETEH
ncbi:MAG: sulfatase [Phycisphaerales bacterium]|jgi:arylsulfatase A-like enzyme|nr:sulfatase [Phycisphaerales bacterium]MBT7171772.1 sulfatase [Phycisphaerales bacterium]